jgi:hypothetical protein
MSFGTGATGILSRQTSNTVQVADELDENGNILESTSFGGVTEVTEESHTDAFVNAATNAQSGADITTSHEFNETNTEYAKQTKTVRSKI